MGQVTVTLNGRTYRLRCGDGEEKRLAELAEHLGLRIDRLAMDFGQPGDERLLLMAALLATDELLDARARLKALEAGDAGEPPGAPYESASLAPASFGVPSEIPEAQSPPIAPATEAPAPATLRADEKSPPAQTPARTSLQARLAEARGDRAAPAAKAPQT
jgi:cell division protein ZapA